MKKKTKRRIGWTLLAPIGILIVASFGYSIYEDPIPVVSFIAILGTAIWGMAMISENR